MTRDYKQGFQLNGGELIKAPIVHHGGCTCCECCNRTRPEYFVMSDGTVWMVSTEGNIGVLFPDSIQFEHKYTANQYWSWRFSSYAPAKGMQKPKYRETDLGVHQFIVYPMFRDLIGFQTDVNRCVIFNGGTIIYEGHYDSRRYPLFFNGKDNHVFTSDCIDYGTGAVAVPIVNEKDTVKFGKKNMLRWKAESESNPCKLVPATYQTGLGVAGYYWRRFWHHNISDDSCQKPEGYPTGYVPCGYDTKDCGHWRSQHKIYACKPPTTEPPVEECGGIDGTGILPHIRGVIPKRICPPETGIVAPRTPLECQGEELVEHHFCGSGFQPGTPLRDQLQGFGMDLCGNFIRVMIKNHSATFNKWYRLVGHVDSVNKLPKHVQGSINIRELFEMDAYDVNIDIDIPQDKWGVPLFWQDYIESFYVYASCLAAEPMWFRFPDQLPHAGAGSQEDLDIAENNADPEKPYIQPLCSHGHETILQRTEAGIAPLNFINETIRNEHGNIIESIWKPDNYTTEPDFTGSKGIGIKRFDVMTVGIQPPEFEDLNDWYYFNGTDWIKGRGTYGDLKNSVTEDDTRILHISSENMNACSEAGVAITANADRIVCCGDYLIVGIGTDLNYRKIIFINEVSYDMWLGYKPESDAYSSESYLCCFSFFGFTILSQISSSPDKGYVESFFINIETDEYGRTISNKEVWRERFPIEKAPVFSGLCSPACRYYFARQNDKEGIYFYRDELENGYGEWRELHRLNILNETNHSPMSGCASTGDYCSIPCEGVDDAAGFKLWENGVPIWEDCQDLSEFTVCSSSQFTLNKVVPCVIGADGVTRVAQMLVNATVPYFFCQTYRVPTSVICGGDPELISSQYNFAENDCTTDAQGNTIFQSLADSVGVIELLNANVDADTPTMCAIVNNPPEDAPCKAKISRISNRCDESVDGSGSYVNGTTILQTLTVPLDMQEEIGAERFELVLCISGRSSGVNGYAILKLIRYPDMRVVDSMELEIPFTQFENPFKVIPILNNLYGDTIAVDECPLLVDSRMNYYRYITLGASLGDRESLEIMTGYDVIFWYYRQIWTDTSTWRIMRRLSSEIYRIDPFNQKILSFSVQPLVGLEINTYNGYCPLPSAFFDAACIGGNGCVVAANEDNTGGVIINEPWGGELLSRSC